MHEYNVHGSPNLVLATLQVSGVYSTWCLSKVKSQSLIPIKEGWACVTRWNNGTSFKVHLKRTCLSLRRWWKLRRKLPERSQRESTPGGCCIMRVAKAKQGLASPHLITESPQLFSYRRQFQNSPSGFESRPHSGGTAPISNLLGSKCRAEILQLQESINKLIRNNIRVCGITIMRTAMRLSSSGHFPNRYPELSSEVNLGFSMHRVALVVLGALDDPLTTFVGAREGPRSAQSP